MKSAPDLGGCGCRSLYPDQAEEHFLSEQYRLAAGPDGYRRRDRRGVARRRGGDPGELFGLVASVPTVWRTLSEIAAGGARTAGRLTKAVNAARRTAWAQAAVRHGGLPGVRVADKTLAGVTCIRLDASSPGPQSSFTMSASWRAGNRQPSSSQRGTTPKRLHGNTNRLALEERDSRPPFQRRASSNRSARPSLRVQGIG